MLWEQLLLYPRLVQVPAQEVPSKRSQMMDRVEPGNAMFSSDVQLWVFFIVVYDTQFQYYPLFSQWGSMSKWRNVGIREDGMESLEGRHCTDWKSLRRLFWQALHWAAFRSSSSEHILWNFRHEQMWICTMAACLTHNVCSDSLWLH